MEEVWWVLVSRETDEGLLFAMRIPKSETDVDLILLDTGTKHSNSNEEEVVFVKSNRK